MSKKLLSTLIASLFAATSALAQSDEDPMRVEGGATAGGIYNRQNATTRPSSRSTRTWATARCRTSGPAAATPPTGSKATARTSAATTSTCSCVAAIYDVFKAGAYFNEMPHDFSTNAITPFAASAAAC